MASGTGSFNYDVTNATVTYTGTFAYDVTSDAPAASGNGSFSYNVISSRGNGSFSYDVGGSVNKLYHVVSGKIVQPKLYRVVNGKIVQPSLYRVVNGKKLLIIGPDDSTPAPGTSGAPAATLAQLVRFGSCPEPGKTTTDVIAKYGQKSMLRVFQGLPGATPTKVTGSSGMHVSLSLGGRSGYQPFVDGVYDNATKAWATGLDPAYFFVEALHEVDNKVNDPDNPLPVSLGVAVKNHFYDLVKSVNPNLRVVNTLTGYAFSPNNPLYTSGAIDSRYGGIKAEILGLDVDGVHSYPYPVMTNRPTNALKFITNHASSGYTDYAFPEWGTSVRQTQDQPDLTILANDWITYYGNYWKSLAKPPLYACWYDSYNAEDPNVNTRASDQLTVPAPINALKGLVSASVVPVA